MVSKNCYFLVPFLSRNSQWGGGDWGDVPEFLGYLIWKCASSHRWILEITTSSFWTRSYLLCLASSFYQYYQSRYTWSKVTTNHNKDVRWKLALVLIFSTHVPSHLAATSHTSSASSVFYGHVRIRTCNLFSRFSYILIFQYHYGRALSGNMIHWLEAREGNSPKFIYLSRLTGCYISKILMTIQFSNDYKIKHFWKFFLTFSCQTLRKSEFLQSFSCLKKWDNI